MEIESGRGVLESRMGEKDGPDREQRSSFWQVIILIS